MMSCCQLTYQKYISEDGVVNLTELEKILKELPPNKNREANKQNTCKCFCHREGFTVLH